MGPVVVCTASGCGWVMDSCFNWVHLPLQSPPTLGGGGGVIWVLFPAGWRGTVAGLGEIARGSGGYVFRLVPPAAPLNRDRPVHCSLFPPPQTSFHLCRGSRGYAPEGGGWPGLVLVCDTPQPPPPPSPLPPRVFER